MAINDELLNKYKDLAKIRDDFNNINEKNFLLPTMGEMTEEDLMSSILSSINDSDNNSDKDEILKTAFYSEEPFSTELGYHPDEGVFMLKATDIVDSKDEWLLNKLDGDTPKVKLSAINDGGQGFTIGNKSYTNFKEYCKSMGTTGAEGTLSLRLAGIDTPEIPHFEMMPFAKKDNSKIKTISFKDIRTAKYKDKEFMYLKYPIKNYDADATIEEMTKWKASARKDDEILEFYVTKKDGKEYWYEIRDEFNIDKSLINGSNDNYNYRAVVTKEDTTIDTVVGGYIAKALAKKKLGQASEFYLMINANNVEPKKTFNNNQYGIANWWYSTKVITQMMNDWNKSIEDVGEAKITYSPFGSDVYGRFLTAVYLKVTEGENTVWINLNKYVLANDDAMVKGNPSYSGSSTLDSIFNGVSDAFKLWSYDKNNIKWLDSFNNLTEKSYYEKIKLHKQITGINFEEAKNCTMMLGDTLLLIPPQNIRNVTNNIYQRTSTMRGKGSAVKSTTNKEQLLEIDCYFYGESGINGIEYKATTPSGDTVTYYMNGLRSLISQFKISPFLPIENGYINDTLGIEAVSLQNFYTETVEGVPGLLKAVFTLREFNYRVYMPDIPVEEVDGSITSETSGIANMTPKFARCFEWEVFRYFYQRSISHGSYVKQLYYNSKEYNKEIYSVKNSIQPVNMCSSNVSFYIPDQNWLDQALQVKMDRDKDKTNIKPVKLNEKSLSMINSLIEIKTIIDNLSSGKDLSSDKDSSAKYVKQFESAVKKFVELHNEKNNKFVLTNAWDKKKHSDVIRSKITELYIKENSIVTTPKNKMFSNIEPMLKVVIENLYNLSIVKNISVDEVHSLDDVNSGLYSVKYNFNIILDFNELSSSEIFALKESIKEKTGRKNDEIFRDSKIVFPMVIQFVNKHNDIEYMLSEDKSKTVMLSKEMDYEILKAADEIKSSYDNGNDLEDENTQDDYLANNVQDYMNPANMQFVPYLEDILCSSVSGSLSNTFTEISLKAVDGYAPQYLGGQDARLELSIITNDELTVSAINMLPQIAIDISKTYRKIITCWPIKIKNDYAQMLGINEVLIDTVDISTIDDAPGVYSIAMRLTSVDRTQRQREALRQLKSNNNAGHIGTDSYSDISIRTYFSLDSALSQSELYPDLDIPTLDELGKYGFRFIRYSGKNRRYPDPDFYVVYSAPYTAMIIKQMVDEVLSKKVYTDDLENNINDMEFNDNLGLKINTTIEAVTGYNILNQNDLADKYDETVQEVSKEVAKKDSNKVAPNLKEDIEKNKDLTKMFNYLTACDLLEGWTIKPGWKATLCEAYTNKSIYSKDKNAYAEEVIQLRKDAIDCIDNILSKKITTYSPTSTTLEAEISLAVNNLFYNNPDGKKLVKILDPVITTMTVTNNNGNQEEAELGGKWGGYGKKYFDEPKFLNYLSGFAYASACAQSATTYYSEKVDSWKWQPSRYIYLGDGEYAKDDKGNKLNYCIVEKQGEGNQNTYSRSLEESILNGHTFGMYGIKTHTTSEINNIMRPDLQYDYFNKNKQAMYKDKKTGKESYRTGLLDPYYNYAGHNSAEGKEYKENVLRNAGYSTEAYLRIVLQHLRRMILEGYIISEMDVIARDFTDIEQAIMSAYSTDEINDTEYIKKNLNRSETSQVSTAINRTSSIGEVIKDIKDSFNKSFAVRMIYPFISAITEKSIDFNSLLEARDFESLNAMILSNVFGENSTTKVDKFLCALNGIGLIPENVSAKAEDISDSQKTFNTIMKDVYIKASEDPRLYVMHSFYDMLTNDKRGRLVRAFPTYYMVFVDEGRKIGSWKLHDNFYNMSSISNIQVVKSRKIAADTCNITMSNMYNSYASSHDAETSQTYTDIYGLRDAFENIFSPKSHFKKEEALRLRKTLPDKVVLQPGVRIHVRMGYTSDGSKLPIVFNGKIAELDVAESVEIVAQGDGHELMNPLTAFGELEAQSLEEAQDNINWFKDIRGAIKRGGVSPRELLTLVLSANHGGLVKKLWNEWFDGRWFNDNPFGITHFGDFRMKDIFENGEVVQNIFEVSDNSLMKGVNEMMPSTTSKKESPTINTSIQDKTAWDLLHMCANSGLEYYGSVRDFGMRSTIFLGKANHYYAYAYQKVDGKILEKRKPFQQFHYYDSYTDIMYNSIKASEESLKTNATGIWQEQKGLWGRGQATVGPIYLDMNIYPEYQKSMTLDTGLIASGNGGVLPNIDRITENWSMNANDDKVNKQLAWRMTMNGLRQNVKDMYQGEICVIGDPSVKPYDRMMIKDTYEDMEGQCEVETVIYSMNIDTGFTTTIMPDVIVRHEDSHENARLQLFQKFGVAAGVAVGTRLAINNLASRDSKLLRSIARTDSLYNTTVHVKKTSRKIAESTGLAKYADSNPAIANLLNKVEVGLTGSLLEEKQIIRWNTAIDDLSKKLFDVDLDFKDMKNIEELSDIIDNLGKMDFDEYEAALQKVYKENQHLLGDISKKDFDEMIAIAKSNDSDIVKELQLKLGDINIKDPNKGIVGMLNNHPGFKDFSEEVQSAIKKIDGMGDTVSFADKKAYEQLSTILKDKQIQEIISKSDDMIDSITDFNEFNRIMFKTSDGTTKFKSISKGLKGGNILDDIMKVFKGGKFLSLGTLALELVKATAVIVLTANVKEMFTRFIQSVQALTIYPMTRNSRPLIAGINGHKGSVYGIPTLDGWNSIQGMIMQTIEMIDKSFFGLGKLALNEFLDRDIYEKTSEQWKRNLGIIDEGVNEIGTERFSQELYNTVSTELGAKQLTYKSLKTRARIQSQDTQNKTTPEYLKYKNTGIKAADIKHNNNIKALYYVASDNEIAKAITKNNHSNIKQFIITHSEKGNASTYIPFENGGRQISYIIYSNNVYDLPLIQEEGILILSRLISKKQMKNKTIWFKSGTRINDKRTWKNTGFTFTIESNGSKELESALNEIQLESSWNNQKMFVFRMDGKQAVIHIYPSKVIITEEKK